jgi:hypothetical protein
MSITYNKNSEVVNVVDNWDALWSRFRSELSLDTDSENKPDMSYKNKYKSITKYKFRKNRFSNLLRTICSRLIKIKK